MAEQTINLRSFPPLASPGHELSEEFAEWIVLLESPNIPEQWEHTFLVLCKS